MIHGDCRRDLQINMPSEMLDPTRRSAQRHPMIQRSSDEVRTNHGYGA